MLVNKLPYKFLLMLMAFSLALVVPFSMLVYFGMEKVVKEMGEAAYLTERQLSIFSGYSDRLLDDLVSYSFYAFVVAFVLSLFFSQRLLRPVKELYRGAQLLKEGDYDIALDVTTNDELAEVTKAFNDLAEAIKRKTNELMRKNYYINAMLDPLWVLDDDNVIVDINPAFTRLFGYGRDDVVGYPVFDFLDDEADKTMRKKLLEREEGVSSTYEISIISKDAGLIPVLISGAPIVEDGEVVGKIGIITDFREQLALREALKDESKKSEAIMDSMADPLVVIDRDYRIVKANLAARVSAGRDITGEHCHEGLHGLESKCFMLGEDCPVRAVFETGRSHRAVHEHRGRGGQKVFDEVVAYPVRDQYGETRQAVEIMRDVTDRKRFEDEIELKNRELTTLNSISRVLSQSLRAEDIFDKVLDKVIGLVGMDGGGIFFLDDLGRDLVCRFHRGFSEDFIKSIGRLRIGEDIPGTVALTGKGMITQDVSKDARADRSLLKHSGLKGFACVPIRGKERLTGVFFIFSINRHAFSEEEERILNSISEMMGIAFENIRLYEKLRDLFEHNRMRRAEERRNLLDLSTMLAARLDMKEVLAASLSLVKDACRADLAWLLAADEEGNLIVMGSSGDIAPEGSLACPAGASCIENYAIEKKETVSLPDIQSEQKFFFSSHVRKYKNSCALPIYLGDKSLGAMSLYYGTQRLPTEDEVYFLQTVTSVLAVALERARLYENVILQKGMADAILESIADGVFTVDPSGRIVSMNGAAAGIVGISAEEASGMSVGELLAEKEENMEFRSKMEECLGSALGGQMRSAEANIVTRKASRLPVMFKGAPVRDEKGQTAGVVFVLRDMSRERELDAMKTDFVKSVSHEFRTPLTAIVGMTEMVLEGEVSGERAGDYLMTILSEGTRLSDMVSDVLDVARIETGKEVFRESEIDFHSLFRNLRENFERTIEKKEIRFISSVEGGLSGYWGDEEKIKQLLKNILDNSFSYSDKGCSVTLEAGRHDGGIRITLKDEGWGMDQEELVHLGEKFFRGRAAASRTKGTGLGFALCKGIVRMHGGSMHVESTEGAGTTVLVDLPMRRNG